VFYAAGVPTYPLNAISIHVPIGLAAAFLKEHSTRDIFVPTTAYCVGFVPIESLRNNLQLRDIIALVVVQVKRLQDSSAVGVVTHSVIGRRFEVDREAVGHALTEHVKALACYMGVCQIFADNQPEYSDWIETDNGKRTITVQPPRFSFPAMPPVRHVGEAVA
jgi:hypothetical protein